MRKLALLTAALLLIFSLVACSDADNNQESSGSNSGSSSDVSDTISVDLGSDSTKAQVIQPEEELSPESVERQEYGATKIKYTYNFNSEGICVSTMTCLIFDNQEVAQKSYESLKSTPLDEMTDLKIEEQQVFYTTPGVQQGKTIEEVREYVKSLGTGYTEYSTLPE